MKAVTFFPHPTSHGSVTLSQREKVLAQLL